MFCTFGAIMECVHSGETYTRNKQYIPYKDDAGDDAYDERETLPLKINILSSSEIQLEPEI